MINHYSAKHLAPVFSRLPVASLREIVGQAAVQVSGRRTRDGMAATLAALPLARIVDLLLSLPVAELRTIASGLDLKVHGRGRDGVVSALHQLVKNRGRFTQANVLDYVVAKYLDSRDFNGCPVHAIGEYFQPSLDRARALIARLVVTGKVSVKFGDIDPNPHIQSLRPHAVELQVNKLQVGDLQHVCVYPSSDTMRKRLGAHDYAGVPFTRRLALATPQLEVVSFRLEVLDTYRRDPRYVFDVSDVMGEIAISDEGMKTLPVGSHVFLRRFGFSYNVDLDRAVCAFLCDLHHLTPDQQKIWQAHVVEGFAQIHPGFYKTQVYGDWTTHVSIFDAFLDEQKHINEMSTLMGRPGLFRQLFERQTLKDFAFLLRPTLSEFHAFVLTLDKLMSDNLNREFFGTDVVWVRHRERDDGVVVETQRGTIDVLSEWMGRNYRTREPEPMHEMVAAFKRVRKLRQSPAHTLEEDKFDQAYVRQQRELMREAYYAVRTIRLIFKNHPSATDYQVPDYLFEGRIWSI